MNGAGVLFPSVTLSLLDGRTSGLAFGIGRFMLPRYTVGNTSAVFEHL